jgi:hypothetical protein
MNLWLLSVGSISFEAYFMSSPSIKKYKQILIYKRAVNFWKFVHLPNFTIR